jgi:hypothetical protein
MNWFDKIGDTLKQYTTGGTKGAPAGDVQAHFDQVMQAAPKSAIAEGLAAAFRSDETPGFGQILATLFTNSNGDQKAGMLNQLIPAVSPAVLAQVLSGAGLAGLIKGTGAQLTPDQAQKVTPKAVQQLAEDAEKANPSIIDTLSSFYAQHPTLVKTLGGTALTIALTKVAEQKRAA